MEKHLWSWSVLGRYLLLQIPSALLAGGILLALQRLGWIPEALAWAGFALWVLKDLALYPLVWRAYADLPPRGNKLIGRTGKTVERLDPRGYIRIGPELWLAELAPGEAPVEKGETITVLEMRGLILEVARHRE